MAAGCRLDWSSGTGVAVLFGERAALGDGGDVGSVEREHPFEYVAGFVDVVALGDHV